MSRRSYRYRICSMCSVNWVLTESDNNICELITVCNKCEKKNSLSRTQAVSQNFSNYSITYHPNDQTVEDAVHTGLTFTSNERYINNNALQELNNVLLSNTTELHDISASNKTGEQGGTSSSSLFSLKVTYADVIIDDLVAQSCDERLPVKCKSDDELLSTNHSANTTSPNYNEIESVSVKTCDDVNIINGECPPQGLHLFASNDTDVKPSLCDDTINMCENLEDYFNPTSQYYNEVKQEMAPTSLQHTISQRVETKLIKREPHNDQIFSGFDARFDMHVKVDQDQSNVHTVSLDDKNPCSHNILVTCETDTRHSQCLDKLETRKDDRPVNNISVLSNHSPYSLQLEQIDAKWNDSLPHLILSRIDDLSTTGKRCCHQCRVCPKIFLHASALARHERTHTYRQPYALRIRNGKHVGLTESGRSGKLSALEMTVFCRHCAAKFVTSEKCTLLVHRNLRRTMTFSKCLKGSEGILKHTCETTDITHLNNDTTFNDGSSFSNTGNIKVRVKSPTIQQTDDSYQSVRHQPCNSSEHISAGCHASNSPQNIVQPIVVLPQSVTQPHVIVPQAISQKMASTSQDAAQRIVCAPQIVAQDTASALQAVSQHNISAVQAASQHNVSTLQALSQQTLSALKAVSQHNVIALQAFSQHNVSALQAVSQHNVSTLQAVSQHNVSALHAVAQHTVRALQAVAEHTVSALQAVAQHTFSALEAEVYSLVDAPQDVSHYTNVATHQTASTSKSTAHLTVSACQSGSQPTDHKSITSAARVKTLLTSNISQPVANCTTSVQPLDIESRAVHESQATPQHLKRSVHGPLKHVCSVCLQQFEKKVQYQKHQKLNRYESSLKCGICLETFNTELLLQQHYWFEHSDRSSQLLTCTFCPYKTKYFFSFVKHVLLHTGERPYVCQQCGTQFISRQKLVQHVNFTHQCYPHYKCPYCSDSLEQLEDLRIHQQAHASEHLYACEKCDKKYYIYGSVHSHMIRDHKKPHTVTVGLQAAESHRVAALQQLICSYAEAINLNSSASCNHCDKRFDNAARLARHIEKDHSTMTLVKCSNISHYPVSVSASPGVVHQTSIAPEPLSLLTASAYQDETLHTDWAQKSAIVSKAISSWNMFAAKPVAQMITTKAYKPVGHPAVGFLAAVSQFAPSSSQTASQPTACAQDVTCKTVSAAQSVSQQTQAVPHQCERNYKCLHGKYTELNAFRLHLQTHRDECSYACAQCDQRFMYSNNLNDHIRRIHNKISKFICSKCGKECKSVEMLTIHNIFKHSAEQMDTNAAVSQPDTSAPQAITQQYHTPVAAAENSVDVHEAVDQHFVPASLPLLTHVRSVCSQRSTGRTEIIEHQKLHPFQHSLKRGVCREAHGTTLLLQQHYPSRHFDETNKLILCNFCPFKVNDVRTFVSHLRLHSGEKPYVCTQCGIRLTSELHLSEHVKSAHQGVKNYKCLQCSEVFTELSAFKLHLQTHEDDERPYACAQCDKRYMHLINLDDHIRCIHNKISKFICSKCGKGCKSVEKLIIHNIFKHSSEQMHLCINAAVSQPDTSASQAITQQSISSLISPAITSCTTSTLLADAHCTTVGQFLSSLIDHSRHLITEDIPPQTASTLLTTVQYTDSVSQAASQLMFDS